MTRNKFDDNLLPTNDWIVFMGMTLDEMKDEDEEQEAET